MIVIDMDMPKNCAECPLHTDTLSKVFCEQTYKCVGTTVACYERMKDCPIKCDIEQISSARYNNGFYDGKKAMEEKIEQIRAEIKELSYPYNLEAMRTRSDVLQIIDKYTKGEQ